MISNEINDMLDQRYGFDRETDAEFDARMDSLMEEDEMEHVFVIGEKVYVMTPAGDLDSGTVESIHPEYPEFNSWLSVRREDGRTIRTLIDDCFTIDE